VNTEEAILFNYTQERNPRGCFQVQGSCSVPQAISVLRFETQQLL